MSDAAGFFTAAWSGLRRGEGDDGLSLPSRVIPDADTPQGPLRAAVGGGGELELLVPLDMRAPFPSSRTGAALEVRDSVLTVGGRPCRFIEVICLSGDQESAFARVADTIAERIRDGVGAGRAVERTLEEFRKLFAGRGGQTVSPEKAAGLAGELIVLDELTGHDQAALRFWTGPDGARHDFSNGTDAIEVKTVSRVQQTVVRISALDQLLEPPGGQLRLAVVILEPTPGGSVSIPALAEAIAGRVSDPDEFSRQLLAAGYDATNQDAWTEHRFTLHMRNLYRVDGDFPRLVPMTFGVEAPPPGVAGIRYDADLSVAPQSRLSDSDADAFLAGFV